MRPPCVHVCVCRIMPAVYHFVMLALFALFITCVYVFLFDSEWIAYSLICAICRLYRFANDGRISLFILVSNLFSGKKNVHESNWITFACISVVFFVHFSSLFQSYSFLSHLIHVRDHQNSIILSFFSVLANIQNTLTTVNCRCLAQAHISCTVHNQSFNS